MNLTLNCIVNVKGLALQPSTFVWHARAVEGTRHTLSGENGGTLIII